MEILYTDEDITISLEYHENTKMYFVHTKVISWSLSKYKKYILIVGKELNKLEIRGIKQVFAIPPSEKEEKWQMLFGFSDTGMRIKEYKVMRLQYGS